MKTLLDYIQEAREYFSQEFNIEEIKTLFMGMYENDEFDEELMKELCPYNMDVRTLTAIMTAYFYSKTGMGGKVTDETCQRFLDMIHKQPVDRIKRILGAGGEGMVYDLGNNRIMKMVFDTDFVGSSANTLKTYMKMVGNHYKTLPNIYKVTKNFIIRENVVPATTKCRKYYDVATTRYPGLDRFGGTMEQCFAHGKAIEFNAIVPKTKETEEVGKWLLNLISDLKSIGVSIENNLGDFKPANLGETKDGRVVYFDW